MKNLLNYLRNTFALLFITSGMAYGQCAAGEVEVTFDITTDTWGYELYWSLVETPDSCGGLTEVANGGNTAVGCYGGGLQVASGADPGAYTNGSTTTTPSFCLTIGQSYTLHAVDDWGDGSNTISSSSQGFAWTMPNADTASISFVAADPKNYNISAGGSYEDANGWTLDWARPVNHVYYPTSQLRNSETMMGVTISNFGLQTATGVFARLNIDLMTGPGTYTNVFTDTMQFANILPDSTDFNAKQIADTSWYAAGTYRYQYIISMDSTDESPESDTLTDFFNLTNGFWSRVGQLATGYPTGDNAYLAGTSSYIDGYEWGSMFYVPAGSGMKMDTFRATFFNSSSCTATDAPYEVRIYEVNLQGTSLDMTTDLTLLGIGFDTVATNPGGAVFGETTVFYDVAAAGAEFEFQDGKLYYISINQENTVAPYLSDGTTRNALYIYGAIINHDFSVYSNTMSYPFYNPLKIRDTGTDAWYTYGWVGGPEPSMSFNMVSTVLNNNNVQKELSDVTVAPNPTTGLVNVSVNLEGNSDVQYMLTDVSGRLINIERSLNVQNEVKTFDISNLPSGVYMIHITSDEGNASKRIIKK